jgi:hypothetical protein
MITKPQAVAAVIEQAACASYSSLIRDVRGADGCGLRGMQEV